MVTTKQKENVEGAQKVKIKKSKEVWKNIKLQRMTAEEEEGTEKI
jgi:hypothetical protein